jgi:hypothetical protein
MVQKGSDWLRDIGRERNQRSKYLKLSLKFFNHNLPLSILEHCVILPSLLRFSSTIVIKSLIHASRKKCQSMHVTVPCCTENMLWCYGFSNYDTANVLVAWSRPVLVQRLRRTYTAHIMKTLYIKLITNPFKPSTLTGVMGNVGWNKQ